MALIQFDGYETLGDSGTDPINAVFDRRYYSSDTLDIRVDTGRYGRRCFQLNDLSGFIVVYARTTPSGAYNTSTTKIWNMSLRMPVEFGSAYYMARWVDENSQIACGLKVFPDGTVALYDHSQSLLALTASDAMRVRCWNRLEIKLTCHPTNGSIVIRCNGREIMNETGVDTSGSSGGAYHVRCLLYSNSGTASYAQRWDDISVLDTTGTTLNDFVGPFTCIARLPEADDTANWTASTGNDHYALVDEREPDDDTTYIESANSIDKFTSSNLPSTVDSVYGVTLGVDYRLDTANGSVNMHQVLDSGGTEYTGDTINVSSNTYAYEQTVWNTDPDTSNAWTVNGYNTTKFGVEIV